MNPHPDMQKTKAAINTVVINSLNARFNVQVLSLSIIHATLYHIFCLCSAKNQCGAGVFLCGVGRWPDAAKNPLNFKGSHLEQETGVEPAFQAWEARVLPMYYSCMIRVIRRPRTDINSIIQTGFCKVLQTSVFLVVHPNLSVFLYGDVSLLDVLDEHRPVLA